MLATSAAWYWLALPRAVEVDHVEHRRARLGERPRLSHRVVAEDGRLGEVALAQPHGALPLQIDGRVEVDHLIGAPLAARTPRASA